MKGILVVNMGGVRSETEAKSFLSNLFNDPCILPFNKIFRSSLAFLISRMRYKKSWRKYQLIGGTPIVDFTETIVQLLQNEVDKNIKVRYAFSYSHPFIHEVLSQFEKEKITDVLVLPMYPHYSFTTVRSIENDIEKYKKKHHSFCFEINKSFYKNGKFIDFWANLISEHISANGYSSPLLLFSAHSIPKNITAAGDTYVNQIYETAGMISEKTELKTEVAFQSGLNEKRWVGPTTKNKIEELNSMGVEEIILIPISFVTENLETLYDLDKDIIPFAKNKLKTNKISRINIPERNPLFIQMILEIIKKSELL